MVRIKNFIKDLGLLLYMGPLQKMVKILPLKTVYGVSKVLARVYYPFVRHELDAVSRDLCRNPGGGCTDSQKRAISLRSCDVYIKRQIEDLLVSTITAEKVHDLVTIEGQEHLDKAFDRGRGVIILVAHFGSFRMVLPALAYNGYQVNQLVGKPVLRHHRPIHKMLFKNKEKEYSSLPVTFIRTDISSRPAVKALKNNESVVIAIDGREGSDWVTVPFLGRTANLSTGALRLASLTRATLLPTFIVRQKDDTHKVFIEEPHHLEQKDTTEAFLLDNMKKLVRPYEKYIYAYPCHFAMTLKVHKERHEKGITAVPLMNMIPIESRIK